MGSNKQREKTAELFDAGEEVPTSDQRQDASHEYGSTHDHPPSYEQGLFPQPDSSTEHFTRPPTIPDASAHPSVPTPESPFNLPTETPPLYTATTRPTPPRIFFAIPQSTPTPTSPFLLAYPPALLTYGIPPATWLSFLLTTSSILSARTHQRALAHATDIATSTAAIPRRLGADLHASTAQMGKNIGRSVRKLDLFGVVGSVVGFAAGSAGSVVGSVTHHLAGAVATPRRTPRERVEAHLAVVNGEWLHLRGLEVRLLGFGELVGTVGGMEGEVVEAAEVAGEGDVKGQLLALRPWIGEVVLGGEGQPLREAEGVRIPPLEKTSHTGTSGKQADATINQRDAVRDGSSAQATSADAQRDTAQHLQLGRETMWLAVMQWVENSCNEVPSQQLSSPIPNMSP